MARGKYIVIEGQDGTGKTTQADLLAAFLESHGIKTIHLKEPGGSPITEEIRKVILNSTLSRNPMTNILLFTTNRHELWHATIKPALEEGTWVICTRNYWSTLAYQGYGEGMSLDVIETITHDFTDDEYMNPSVGVVLSFPDIEALKKRIAERGELVHPDTFESKDAVFHRRVQDAYPTIAKKFGLKEIDASQSIEQVQAEIRKLITI